MKTFLVTGANSGIGKQTVYELLHQNHQVIMVCRNRERGEQALADIAKTNPPGQADIYIADLSSLTEIDQLANTIKENYDRLDGLINNAGLFRSKKEFSKDGYELTFAVNHLAYFALTQALLPLLVRTGTQASPTRIVNVASRAHRYGNLRLSEVTDPRFYSGSIVYGTSKLANILFTFELARRLEGQDVVCNCLHPGVVKTKFASGQGGFFGALFSVFRWGMRSPKKGAETVVFLATSEKVAGQTGGYYKNCQIAKPSRVARDENLARQLWDQSESLVKAIIPQTL